MDKRLEQIKEIAKSGKELPWKYGKLFSIVEEQPELAKEVLIRCWQNLVKIRQLFHPDKGYRP